MGIRKITIRNPQSKRALTLCLGNSHSQNLKIKKKKSFTNKISTIYRLMGLFSLAGVNTTNA